MIPTHHHMSSRNWLWCQYVSTEVNSLLWARKEGQFQALDSDVEEDERALKSLSCLRRFRSSRRRCFRAPHGAPCGRALQHHIHSLSLQWKRTDGFTAGIFTCLTFFTHTSALRGNTNTSRSFSTDVSFMIISAICFFCLQDSLGAIRIYAHPEMEITHNFEEQSGLGELGSPLIALLDIPLGVYPQEF